VKEIEKIFLPDDYAFLSHPHRSQANPPDKRGVAPLTPADAAHITASFPWLLSDAPTQAGEACLSKKWLAHSKSSTNAVHLLVLATHPLQGTPHAGGIPVARSYVAAVQEYNRRVISLQALRGPHLAASIGQMHHEMLRHITPENRNLSHLVATLLEDPDLQPQGLPFDSPPHFRQALAKLRLLLLAWKSLLETLCTLIDVENIIDETRGRHLQELHLGYLQDEAEKIEKHLGKIAHAILSRRKKMLGKLQRYTGFDIMKTKHGRRETYGEDFDAPEPRVFRVERYRNSPFIGMADFKTKGHWSTFFCVDKEKTHLYTDNWEPLPAPPIEAWGFEDKATGRHHRVMDDIVCGGLDLPELFKKYFPIAFEETHERKDVCSNLRSELLAKIDAAFAAEIAPLVDSYKQLWKNTLQEAKSRIDASRAKANPNSNPSPSLECTAK
jgi:hypothetical protein